MTHTDPDAGRERPRAAIVQAVAGAVALTVAATAASAQNAGPVMASAAALGISHAEAVALEREWDALDGPTRVRMLCAGTRGQCRTYLEGLRVYRSVPEVFRSYGPASVRRFLRNKDWSHIVPRSQGGGDAAANGRWEVRRLNRARGARVMTLGEIQTAARAATSAAFRERLRQAAGRMGRGTAAGAITVAAIMIVTNTVEYQSGRITEQEFMARLRGEIARDTAIAAIVGAALGAAAVSQPLLVIALAPAITFIATELWSTYGVSVRQAAGAILASMRNTVRRWFIRLTTPPIFRQTSAVPGALLPGYAPAVWKTATSRTLYAPPIADPNELAEFIASELGRRGVHGPEPI